MASEHVIFFIKHVKEGLDAVFVFFFEQLCSDIQTGLVH